MLGGLPTGQATAATPRGSFRPRREAMARPQASGGRSVRFTLRPAALRAARRRRGAVSPIRRRPAWAPSESRPRFRRARRQPSVRAPRGVLRVGASPCRSPGRRRPTSALSPPSRRAPGRTPARAEQGADSPAPGGRRYPRFFAAGCPSGGFRVPKTEPFRTEIAWGGPHGRSQRELLGSMVFTSKGWAFTRTYRSQTGQLRTSSKPKSGSRSVHVWNKLPVSARNRAGDEGHGSTTRPSGTTNRAEWIEGRVSPVLPTDVPSEEQTKTCFREDAIGAAISLSLNTDRLQLAQVVRFLRGVEVSEKRFQAPS